MPKPLVAIVGRPNVGKSTLFNRLAGRKIAVVHETPALTRDRIYADCHWHGKSFRIVDTGGIQPLSDDPLIQRVLKQTRLALEEADLILFMVDGKEGLMPLDLEVVELLRKTKKPKILVVNKIEGKGREEEAVEFFQLGLGDFTTISAIHGTRVDELLDQIVRLLPEGEEEPEIGEGIIRIAIVGRPNVGKSSLLNAILNEERVIVDEAPGTTRDSIDTFFTLNQVRGNEQAFVFIDTTGIRKKAKIKSPIEYYSILRALSAIERADVVLLVIDAREGVGEQDKKIARYAYDEGKGCVIVVNKWDLVEADSSFTIHGVEISKRNRRLLIQDYIRILRQELAFIDYAPIVFSSALSRLGIPQIIQGSISVAQELKRQVPTAVLNKVIQKAQLAHPLIDKSGKQFKIYYATQTKVAPPTFLLFANQPELWHFSYERYLENQLRKNFSFQGVPIRILVRKKMSKRQPEKLVLKRG